MSDPVPPLAPTPDAAPPRAGLLRDRWAWVSALGVLPLLARSVGAPLGEAVAEDFDFLRHALLEPAHSPWDGGGSLAFWRPVAHQLYYQTMGPLILSHPRVVAMVHTLLLALAALLLYRTARRVWPGPAAAAMATFPLLAESTRTLIAWPSHFVDLGAFLFTAVALHEAGARRLWSALPALLLALLCKEVCVAAGLLLPFMPALAEDRRGRALWAAATGAVLLAWVAAYLAVRHHAGLALPHGLEKDAAVLATPAWMRLLWAFVNSSRAIMSLSAHPGPLDPWVTAAMGAVGLVASWFFAFRASSRARLQGAKGAIVWGTAWFVLASAALATVYPMWMPNRSQYASLGAGVALVALTWAAHPALTAALVFIRVALIAAAPGAPPHIPYAPVERGAFVDFAKLSRLQRLMEAVRTRLRASEPRLPHGAVVVQHYVPLASEYAFGGSHALQVWYRDTTLRWMRFDEFRRRPEVEPVTLVEYQPTHVPQVALVDPHAMRALLEASDAVGRSDWGPALSALARADSLQRDRDAAVFLGALDGKRALCRVSLQEWDAAERDARSALQLWRESTDARYVLAYVAVNQRRLDEAAAQLDTLLAIDPGDESARALARWVRDQPARGP